MYNLENFVYIRNVWNPTQNNIEYELLALTKFKGQNVFQIILIETLPVAVSIHIYIYIYLYTYTL